MAKIKKLRNFIQIKFLTEILDSVKKYLPNDLKYARIYNETVGFEQGSMQLEFYNSKWQVLELNKNFNLEEQEIYGELCLSDYIHNSLIGMVQDCDLIDWKNSDEFFDKVQMDTEYFYEYK